MRTQWKSVRLIGAGVVMAVAVGLGASGALSDAGPPGALTQPSGNNGCIRDASTSDGCTSGRGLDQAEGLAVSPDSKNVYVAGEDSDAVAVFKRNTSNGQLSQLSGGDGCVENTGPVAPAIVSCSSARQLDNPEAVVVSPEGTNVYVAAESGDAVVAFSRNTSTGVLTQLSGTDGCIAEGSSDGCAVGRALDGATALAISSDGKYLYAGAENGDAIAVFKRNLVTGALTQLGGTGGCVNEAGDQGCATGRGIQGVEGLAITSSPVDGYLYAAAEGSNGDVSVFKRAHDSGVITQLAGTDGCINESGNDGCSSSGRGIDDASGVALSPDEQNLYVASQDAVAAFARNAGNGKITQISGTPGCLNEGGSDGCGTSSGTDGGEQVVVSPDNENVYMTAETNGALARFFRDGNGGLTQPASGGRCYGESVSGCKTARGTQGATGLAMSPNGKNVYVGTELDDAVVVFNRAIPGF